LLDGLGDSVLEAFAVGCFAAAGNAEDVDVDRGRVLVAVLARSASISACVRYFLVAASCSARIRMIWASSSCLSFLIRALALSWNILDAIALAWRSLELDRFIVAGPGPPGSPAASPSFSDGTAMMMLKRSNQALSLSFLSLSMLPDPVKADLSLFLVSTVTSVPA
jgi:hypothetical protein